MSPTTYVFKRVSLSPFNDILAVKQDGVLVSAFPLKDKILYNFTFDQLVNWLGRDNAANILVSGEEVSITREHQLLFDFSRFKP